MRKKTVAKIVIMILLVINLIYLVGIRKVQNDEQVKEIKTLVAGTEFIPESLDPQSYSDIYSARVSSQIYNTLISRTDKLDIVPELAQSWIELENQTILFKLREDVKFHDGTPMTVNDVKFSIERALENSRFHYLKENVLKVEARDDYNILIQTRGDIKEFMIALSSPSFSILNEKNTQVGNDFVNNPVGTGPFKFISRKNNEEIDLIANENYFMERPKIDKLVFKKVKNATEELLAKKIDFAYEVPKDNIEKIELSEDFELLTTGSYEMANLKLNIERPPFNDKKMREFLFYSLNFDELDEFVYGEARVAKSPFSMFIESYKSIPDYNKIYELEEGKKKLAQTQYKVGTPIKIIYNEEFKWKLDVAYEIKKQLLNYGIEVEVIGLPYYEYFESILEGNGDIHIINTQNTSSLPEEYLFSIYKFPKQREFFSPELKETLKKIIYYNGSEEDSKEALYSELQEEMKSEAPIISYGDILSNIGYSKKIVNFEPNLSGNHSFSKVDINEALIKNRE